MGSEKELCRAHPPTAEQRRTRLPITRPVPSTHLLSRLHPAFSLQEVLFGISPFRDAAG